MKTVLLTGASGFVGGAVNKHLQVAGYRVRYLTRGPKPFSSPDVYVMDSESDLNTFTKACESVDVVCHIAGLAHQIGKSKGQQGDHFDRVNAQFTANLTKAAVIASVPHFIFISSIGVLGSKTYPGAFFSEDSAPMPFNPYTLSKRKAEAFVQELTSDSHTAWTIVRPPLVHGLNAPGNLQRLKRLVQRGHPLPFANISNQRSMVHVDNLSKFLLHLMEHPEARNQTFLVRDQVDYSTTEIVMGIYKQLGMSPRLFAFPESVLKFAATLAGQKHAASQLYDSLVVSDQKARRLLNFQSDAVSLQV